MLFEIIATKFFIMRVLIPTGFQKVRIKQPALCMQYSLFISASIYDILLCPFRSFFSYQFKYCRFRVNFSHKRLTEVLLPPFQFIFQFSPQRKSKHLFTKFSIGFSVRLSSHCFFRTLFLSFNEIWAFFISVNWILIWSSIQIGLGRCFKLEDTGVSRLSRAHQASFSQGQSIGIFRRRCEFFSAVGDWSGGVWTDRQKRLRSWTEKDRQKVGPTTSTTI